MGALDIFFPFFSNCQHNEKKYFHVRCMGDYICNVLYRCHTEHVSNTCGGPNGMYAFTARRASHFPVKKLSAFAAVVKKLSVSAPLHKRRWSEIQSTALI